LKTVPLENEGGCCTAFDDDDDEEDEEARVFEGIKFSFCFFFNNLLSLCARNT
jgi:hypothetical protein